MSVLTEAVERDPTFARAWTALAWAQIATASFTTSIDTAAPLGLSEARRGVALDPSDAGAHAALAHLLGTLGDFAAATPEWELALQLNPGDADILTQYSGWAAALGAPEKGAEAADRAIRLNPNFPVWAANFFRHAYFMAGRYEDALKMLQRQPAENLTKLGRGNPGGDLRCSWS